MIVEHMFHLQVCVNYISHSLQRYQCSVCIRTVKLDSNENASFFFAYVEFQSALESFVLGSVS